MTVTDRPAAERRMRAPGNARSGTITRLQPLAGSRRRPLQALVELLLEDAVLFDEVLQDLLLLAVDPTRQREENHPKRDAVGRHQLILTVSTELRRNVDS